MNPVPPPPLGEEPDPAEEQFELLVEDFEKALTEGRPTDELERELSRTYGERALEVVQALKWLNGIRVSPGAVTKSSPPPETPHGVPQPRTRRFGRFQVLARLGSGGNGVVFRVFDPHLNREAALKVPRADVIWRPDSEQRFQQEARAAAALNHPQVIPIYEAGQIDGVHYILSAYCAGPNLSHWLHDRNQRGARVEPTLAARWVSLLADGIEYAHSMGIVHRDLKPANILLDFPPAGSTGRAPETDYVPRIADFGLCKVDRDDASLTLSGAILGTLPYMAPEQAHGETSENAAPVDIYALGAILFELLTGRPPLTGRSDFDLLRKIGTDDPPLVRTLRPDVPRDLENICRMCLERDPTRRYSTARELSLDLMRFLRGEPVIARTISMSHRLVRSISRRRLPAWSVISGAAILVAIIVALAFAYSNLTREHRDIADSMRDVESREQQLIAGRRKLEAVAQSQNRVIQLGYEADIQRAFRIWRESLELEVDNPHAGAEIKDLLLRHVPSGGTADQRGFEWYYLWRLCEPERFDAPLKGLGNFVGHTGAVYQVGFTPDSRSLITASEDKTVRIWDVETRTLLRTLVGHNDEVNAFCLTGDARLLATACEDRTIKLWDFSAGRELRTLTGHQAEVVGVMFHAQRPLLLSADHQGTLKLWNVETFEEVMSWQGHGSRVQFMQFAAPDSMVTCGMDGVVKIWDVARANSSSPIAAKEIVFDHPLMCCVQASSPLADRRPILAALGQLRLEVFRQDSGYRFAMDQNARINSAAFSADETQLVVVGDAGAIRTIDVATRKSVAATTGNDGKMLWSAAPSRDGRYLAVCGDGGEVSLWDCSTTPRHTILPGGVGALNVMEFSANSRWLVVGSDFASEATDARNSPTLVLWDLEAVPPTSVDLSAGTVSNRVRFSPVDSRLAIASQDRDRTWRLRIHDVESHREVTSISLSERQVEQLAISADGKRIQCACPSGRETEIVSFDIGTGESAGKIALPAPVSDLAMSRDGSRVAFVVGSRATIQSIPEMTPITSFDLPFVGVTDMAFSLRSDKLVVRSRAGHVCVCDCKTSSIESSFSDLPGIPITNALDISADGHSVLSDGMGQHYRTFRLRRGKLQPELRFAGPNFETFSARFSPNGKTIAAAYIIDQPPERSGNSLKQGHSNVILWRITGNEAPVVANTPR